MPITPSTGDGPASPPNTEYLAAGTTQEWLALTTFRLSSRGLAADGSAGQPGSAPCDWIMSLTCTDAVRS